MALGDPQYMDLTLERARKLVEDPAIKLVLDELGLRIQSIRSEQDIFRSNCDRFDQLYYTTDFTEWGADLWAAHSSATTPGRSHVSINSPATYVDVPAALQSVEPVENMLAREETPEGRSAAAHYERMYAAWKMAEDFDLKWHKGITTKGLYGRTAARVYWEKDPDDGDPRPCVEIIESPRNLYMAYRSDSYSELEWAAYVMRYEPNALAQEYGLYASERRLDNEMAVVPYLTTVGTDEGTRPWYSYGDAKVEVWDYWYRKPLWRNGKFVKMETWNVVIGGNVILREPTKYGEYGGRLPYLPVYNTFIPGVPNGRSDLYDVEQLIREKFEKVTAGSQMIANAVAGDYWQLVGPDAPTRVDPALKPTRNTVVGPGAGNRIEVIAPFIAQFQLEQYLGRIDRELAGISGLNDLLLGLAPAQVLSSSKAVNALIANYESRLSIRRKLLYKWRRDIWDLASAVWAYKDKRFRSIVQAGAGVLDIIDPSLAPHDEMETATRAANLVNARLWSQRRAMDAVGVDDPESEQDLIREESTDSTLFPEKVQVMVQLLAALQSLGLQAPQGAQEQAQAQLGSGQEDLRQALGAATPDNTEASQLPGDQGITPPIPGAGPNEGGEQVSPFAAAQQPALAQTMISEGQAKSRILTQQKLGRR